MKYVGDQITVARKDSRNEDVPTADSQVGIETNDILRYLNYAQEGLQGLILGTSPNSFQDSYAQNTVANQEAYSIDDRVYGGERIINVEYSPTGLDRDYYEIHEKDLSYRRNYPQTHPLFYIRQNGQVLLSPPPTQSVAKVRATYERQVDTLDIRRGQITAITLSATQLTALTLDITSHESTELEVAQYLCINDKYGNVKMYNIPITSYDSVTGVVTLDAFTFDDGETGAIGDYVTVGKYTTTHSKLKDICERYLELYATMKCFARDAADDIREIKEELAEVKKDILSTYQNASKDEQDIQISNEELMLGE